MTEILQGPLTRLSLTKGAPRVLSNAERARLYRIHRAAGQPSQTYNDRAWNFRETRAYNPDPPSAEDVRQAYAFKMGVL